MRPSCTQQPVENRGRSCDRWTGAPTPSNNQAFLALRQSSQECTWTKQGPACAPYIEARGLQHGAVLSERLYSAHFPVPERSVCETTTWSRRYHAPCPVDATAASAAATTSINPSQPPGRTLLTSAAFNGDYGGAAPHESLSQDSGRETAEQQASLAGI